MIIINEERHFEYTCLQHTINKIQSDDMPMPPWNQLSEAYFHWEKQVRKSLTDGEFDYNIDKFKKLLVDFKCLLDAKYPMEIRAFEAIGIKGDGKPCSNFGFKLNIIKQGEHVL